MVWKLFGNSVCFFFSLNSVMRFCSKFCIERDLIVRSVISGAVGGGGGVCVGRGGGRVPGRRGFVGKIRRVTPHPRVFLCFFVCLFCLHVYLLIDLSSHAPTPLFRPGSILW